MLKTMIVALIVLLCAGCGTPMEYNHKFEIGDCAKMKIDGLIGMVTRTHKFHDAMYIRFSTYAEQTTTNFLGGTNPIMSQPYMIVRVQEFELDQCDT